MNDREFARYWVESRQRTKKVSRRIIVGELRSKGIVDEIIDESMRDISDEDEFTIALDFASKKTRSLAKLENSVAYRRLHGALARRGFSGSVISRVLAELGKIGRAHV